jgi:hypothetical protein
MRTLSVVWIEIVPVLVLGLFVWFDRFHRKQQRERPPIDDKLLRPPGYGLSRALEELNDRMIFWLFITLTTSVFYGVSISQSGIRNWKIEAISFTPFIIIIAIGTAITWRCLMKMRSLRLGLLGEQAVADQLANLMYDGYRVFHDLEVNDKPEKPWNIDHIVVGRSGVFAIETKTRSKRKSRNDLPEQHAVFDGKVLHFPWCEDRNAPNQARRNAKWLAKALTSATGEHIKVQPIVALPGWFVTLKTDSDVKVLSGKQISGFIKGGAAKLSSKTIQQIAYQLEQRCRDVEF